MKSGYAILFGLGYLAAFVLMGFGAIFLMAAPVESTGTRLITGLAMLGGGIIIIVGLRLRQRVIVEQKVTLKPTQIRELKCNNCGASLSEKDYTIKNDTVIIKCTYCGALYELHDNPVW